MKREERQTAGSSWRSVASDVAKAVRFYSRIPLPALPFEADPHGLPDFRRLARVLPLAALVIALLPAVILAAALHLDLGPWLSAALAVAGMTLVTGAFHEDGLADMADGFGGGATPERRLAIMRDSLIGSFGASALILAFALRIGALATLADRLQPGQAALVLVIVAGLSRTAGLMPLTLLPPARLDGASYAVGQPSRRSLWGAAALAAAIAIPLGLLADLPLSALALMGALAALAGHILTRLSNRLIGGQTGDVAGAVQQVAEVLAMVGLVAALEP
jgi:adenosylcobinamide-GDP ribazoletransferase